MPASKKPDPKVTDVTVVSNEYDKPHAPGGHKNVTSAAAIIDSPAQEKTAGPVPAEVVANRRDTFWRRLPVYALILVVLYFVISSQIQSAQNGDDLHKSLAAQGKLLKTVQRDEGYVILASQYIGAQAKVIKEQNARLKAHGLPTIPLPPPPTPPAVSKRAHQAVNGGGSPSSQPSASPQSGHSPASPTARPSTTPTANPTPTKTATPVVCVRTPILGKKCIPPGLTIGVFYGFIR